MTKRAVFLPALVVAAAVLAACSAAVLMVSTKAEAAFPGLNGRIAFSGPSSCEVPCDAEIYSVNPDGSGRLQLTDNRFNDYQPAYSPDGRRVAFTSERFGDADVYTMTPAGQEIKNLTNNLGIDDYDPAWSPDGSRIAFVSFRDGSSDLYVMNADGTGVRRLTRYADPSFIVVSIAWSPDGTKIAFTGTVEYSSGQTENIYVVDADGSGRTTRLTDGDGWAYNSWPSWSPDGTEIAFTRTGVSSYEIFVMASDGTDERKITDSEGVSESHPAWAPDGRKIAFMVTDEETARDDIYVMNADGSARRNITDDSTLDGGAPDWGPKPVAPDPGSGEECTITGTRGNDELEGTGRADVICGLGGGDAIHGGGGDDVLRGGAGVDAIAGGSGSDELYGQKGVDSLDATDGERRNDSMNGGGGTDACRGDRGDTRTSCG